MHIHIFDIPPPSPGATTSAIPSTDWNPSINRRNAIQGRHVPGFVVFDDHCIGPDAPGIVHYRTQHEGITELRLEGKTPDLGIGSARRGIQDWNGSVRWLGGVNGARRGCIENSR